MQYCKPCKMHWSIRYKKYWENLENIKKLKFLIRLTLVSITTTLSTTTTTTTLFTTTTKAPSTLVDPIEICYKGNGFYPDYRSGCVNYFLCVFSGTPGAKVYTYSCPDNLRFDPISLACNFDVVCGLLRYFIIVFHWMINS